MPYFTQAPGRIEAVEIKPGNDDALRQLANGAKLRATLQLVPAADGTLAYLTVRTRAGLETGSLGDWLIKNVAGDLLLCTPEIFAQTYRPA